MCGCGGAFKDSPETKQSSSELRNNLHRSVCVLHPLPRGFSMTLPGSASPLSGAPSILFPRKQKKNRKTRASSLCAQRSPIGLSWKHCCSFLWCFLSQPPKRATDPDFGLLQYVVPPGSGARLWLFLLFFFFLPHV